MPRSSSRPIADIERSTGTSAHPSHDGRLSPLPGPHLQPETVLQSPHPPALPPCRYSLSLSSVPAPESHSPHPAFRLHGRFHLWAQPLPVKTPPRDRPSPPQPAPPAAAQSPQQISASLESRVHAQPQVVHSLAKPHSRAQHIAPRAPMLRAHRRATRAAALSLVSCIVPGLDEQ